MDANRLESLTESEDTISEMKKRFEREKKILISELEVLSENNRRMQNERMQMQNDYEELR